MVADFGAEVKDVVQDWAEMPTEPAGTAILADLWSGSPFPLGATDLAQRCNSRFGTNILGSDITTTTTVDQLIQMLQ